MPSVENEVGLDGVDLESGLRDRRDGDLGGCRLNCPKKYCRANVGEHDHVGDVRPSRSGWLSLQSRQEVGPKVQVCQRQGQGVLDVHDQLVVQLVLRHWVGWFLLPGV